MKLLLQGVCLILLVNLIKLNISPTLSEFKNEAGFYLVDTGCTDVIICEQEEIKAVEVDPWDISSLEEERRLLELSNINEDVAEYIKRFHPTARMEERRYKIPYSISMAQGLLESDAGKSTLAEKANNHFGIKGRMKGGYRLCDDSCNDRFNIYDNAWTSWRAHSQLLCKERYMPLHSDRFVKSEFLKYSQSTGKNYRTNGSSYYGKDPNFSAKLKNLEKYWDVPYKRWAYGLDILGYATSNRYAESLIRIVETNSLQNFDGLN